MSSHLITVILEIVAEADKIVHDARQKAGEIITSVHNEVERIQSAIEDEYHRKLETLKAQLAVQQTAEVERLRNKVDSLKKNLLLKNGMIMEEAVAWTIKHLYEN